MWFSKKKRVGKLYSIIRGEYAGSFFIFIDKKDDKCGFLSIPKMENVWATEEIFDNAVDHGIIEYVERVPKEVRKVVILQFKENESKLRPPT